MEPIKHLKKEKKHLERLRLLRGEIYTPVAPLEVGVHTTAQPVPPGEQAALSYRPIGEKGIWGGVFSCAWFRVRGTVPQSAGGRHVVVHIHVGGEGAVYDGTEPRSGITLVMSYIDRLQAGVGKSVIEVSPAARPGQPVELYIDAGYNGYYNYPFGFGIFHDARLCVVDDGLLDFYYDYLCAASLLSVTEDMARRAQLEYLLDKSFALRRFAPDAARAVLAPLFEGAPDPSVTFTAVGHSHLDLAWLWPIRETKRKAQRTFANQLCNARRYPWYIYGASQPWQFEYIKENRPGQYAQLQALAERGQLELQGGMYVEADANLASGEALIRQIHYGKDFFQREFGQSMSICWLPDVFGYNGNLPQIMKKCGLEYFMTIKLSWNEHNRFPYRSFVWQGIDGSQVLVHMPPDDTYNSAGSPACVRHAADNYPEASVAPEALLLYGIGDGGGGPGEAHLELVRRQRSLAGSPRVIPGTAAGFFARLESYRDALPRHRGELYLEKHQGTYTTQAANKRFNRRCEYALQDLEALCALAWTRGRAYPGNRLDSWWKAVLLYQFHDIIPGSSIGWVYTASRRRYAELLAEMDAQRDSVLGFLAARDGLSAFNPTSFARTEYFRRDGMWYAARLGPHGFSEALPLPPPRGLVSDGDALENDLIALRFGPDGTIVSAVLKADGKELAGGKLGALRLYPDKFLRYNAWDIDWKYHTKPSRQLTPYRVKCFIDGPRAVRRSWYRHGRTTLTQDVVLYPGRPVVYFETRCDWHETLKMLRAEFDTAIDAPTVRCDIQLGAIERSTGDRTPQEQAQFEICAHKYVALSHGGHGAALLNDCKYGHRVKGGRMSLNLLRGTVYPDLKADRGRHRFTYALHLFAGDCGADTLAYSYALNKPAVLMEGAPDVPSMASTDCPAVVVETIKLAHSGDGVVLRLYESGGSPATCALSTVFTGEAVQTDLLENELGPIDLSRLELGAYEILTVKIKAAPRGRKAISPPGGASTPPRSAWAPQRRPENPRPPRRNTAR